MRRWSISSRSARLRSSELGLSSTVVGCRANCQTRSEYVIRSVRTPALTVATILSTTCWAEQTGANKKKRGRNIKRVFSRKGAKAQRKTLKVEALNFSMLPPLERLRNPEMQVAAMQPKDRGRAVKKT